MPDRELTTLLMGMGAIELVAWSMAWLLDWQLAALVGAVAVSFGVSAVIVVVFVRKKRPKG